MGSKEGDLGFLKVTVGEDKTQDAQLVVVHTFRSHSWKGSVSFLFSSVLLLTFSSLTHPRLINIFLLCIRF